MTSSDDDQKDEGGLREQLSQLEHQIVRLNEAERQVQGARAQAQALLDNIPHMAWMKDTRGVFLAVNEAFAEACGYPQSEILGRTDADVWPAHLAERYMADDQRVIASARKFLVEELIAETTGTKWFETFKTPIFEADGTVTGTVGLARDITERKRAEEQQRALNRRMQEAQKLESLGVLAGGIAHDFNNLLVGVLSNAELALQSLDDDARSAGVQKRLEDIRQAALHASELTNQMLAYSGKGHFVVRAVCLNDMIRDMGQLLGAAISKKATIHYQLAAGLPWVAADVAQMRQVIMNLITNASEALGERAGNIWIRTGRQSLGDSGSPALYGPTKLEPGEYLYLEVTDDGCGMNEETRARLFEPFFTTKFTGRGLGLSAVQGIVRGHRGGIVLSTAEGAGTTITILLPGAVEPAPPAPPDRRLSDDFQGQGLVLMIDDDERVRRVTELLLRGLGFEVASIGSGREALEAFQTLGPRVRLVLLDMTMPDLSGEQVLTELRKMDAAVPVILCSGYDEHEMLRRVPLDQVSGFLQKPYRLEVLKQKLREALGSRA